MKATLENVKNFIATLSEDLIDENYFGMRIDECSYNVGDTANYSHQLYEDPWFDDDGELVYPYVEDGIYAGYYDAGELNGTCCIGFDPTDDSSIEQALKIVSCYFGYNLHILCGDSAVNGEDTGEIIIEDAKVIAAFEK